MDTMDGGGTIYYTPTAKILQASVIAINDIPKRTRRLIIGFSLAEPPNYRLRNKSPATSTHTNSRFQSATNGVLFDFGQIDLVNFIANLSPVYTTYLLIPSETAAEFISHFDAHLLGLAIYDPFFSP